MICRRQEKSRRCQTKKAKGKAFIGRFPGKHVAGVLGGAAATIAIPKAAGLNTGYKNKPRCGLFFFRA